VYGYGNPGRRDDGLGMAAIAEIAAGDYDKDLVALDSNYQLNVEDALELARYEIVCFVDASYAPCAPFRFYPLRPDAKIGFTTHAMSPGSVVALSKQLYNAHTRAYMIEIQGYEWAMREGLSTSARENLDKAIQFLAPLLRRPCLEDFDEAALRFSASFRQQSGGGGGARSHQA
jgi:hydrogenase maturation protease